MVSEVMIVVAVGLVMLLSSSFFIGSPSVINTINSFLDLNDTPVSYSGEAGKVPTVNSDENGLEFTTITGGGSGTTYTSGTPSTIQVDNDLNTISQNFEGNFMFFLSNQLPLTDANVNIGISDLNSNQSCPVGQALQSAGNTTSCVSVGGSNDLNWDSLNDYFSPVDYDVNVTNKPHIPTESEIDANALGIINGLDLNNTLNYVATGTDVNCSYNPDCVISTDANITTQNGILANGDINSTTGTVYSDRFFAIDKTGLTFFGADAITCGAFWVAFNTFTPCINDIDLGSTITYWGNIFLTGSLQFLNGNNPAMILQSNQYAFVTAGTTNTGLKFNNTKSAITADVNGEPVFIISMIQDKGMVGFDTRSTAPVFTSSKNFKGSSIYWQEYPDMNNILLNQKADGTFTYLTQSAYNTNLNTLQNLDINSGNLTVDGNITTDQNFYGQLITPFAENTISCNTVCESINYAGAWACVESVVVSSSAQTTCSNTSGNRNCVCRN